MNSTEGYNDEHAQPFLLRRFTPRSYSSVAMLAGICEHPRRTAARPAVKRAALKTARGLMGEAGYGKLRERVISRR